MKFDPEASYVRPQIVEAFGGLGPGALPMKDGHIVAGLLDPATNAVTHLSGEIDVYPKVVPKAAKKLAHPIPIFLKISTEFWRYLGEYKLSGISKSKKDLDPAKRDLANGRVAAMIRLEPVKRSR